MQVNIYLAGPMTGIPDFNFPLFDHVAERLRTEGHKVYSPVNYWLQMLGPDALHILNGMNPPELNGFVRRAFATQLAWICRNADAMHLLPGWQTSRGTQAERLVAIALDIPVEEVLDSMLQTFVTRGPESHEHRSTRANP